MEANSKKHRFRKGRSATFSIDGYNITIGKKLYGRESRRKVCLHVSAMHARVCDRSTCL